MSAPTGLRAMRMRQYRRNLRRTAGASIDRAAEKVGEAKAAAFRRWARARFATNALLAIAVAGLIAWRCAL